MRKFKLLKDLPWCKAGTIGVQYDNFQKVSFEENIHGDINIHEFEDGDVIFYPEWFEEIKEEPKKVISYLWEVYNNHFMEYFQYGGFRTEKDAEKFFAGLVFRKYKPNGQEVWQEFEE